MARPKSKTTEMVIFKGVKYYRYPKSKDEGNSRYFTTGCREKLLHRAIWESVHGNIPTGYVIHHIDENPLNNDISNLAILSNSKHTTEHLFERHKKSSYALRKQRVTKAIEANKKAYKKTIARKEICIICEKTFETKWRRKPKYCSVTCVNRASRAARGIPQDKSRWQK